MKSLRFLLLFLLPGIAGAACKAQVVGSGSSDDPCAGIDCPTGQCVEITPGGHWICLTPPPEATQCNGGMFDQCCSTDDCSESVETSLCIAESNLLGCSGPMGSPAFPHNICADPDDCAADTDCVYGANTGDWVCLPRGAFSRPNRVCLKAFCRTDADCNAAPGGVCEPIYPSCCEMIPTALGCSYPGGCVHPGDCAGDAHCDLQDGAGTCLPGPAQCNF